MQIHSKISCAPGPWTQKKKNIQNDLNRMSQSNSRAPNGATRRLFQVTGRGEFQALALHPFGDLQNGMGAGFWRVWGTKCKEVQRNLEEMPRGNLEEEVWFVWFKGILGL